MEMDIVGKTNMAVQGMGADVDAGKGKTVPITAGNVGVIVQKEENLRVFWKNQKPELM